MKIVSALTFALAALVGLAAPSSAQTDYPTDSVTLIVPWGAGGGTDNLIRTFQPALQEALGQPVVVENRPGGGSTIGTEMVVRAEPDGYTVLAVDSAILVNPALHDDLPYDTMEDLEPVSLLATGPVVLVAHPDAEADTFEEFLEAARERPGEIPFASGGHGSSTHLALGLMQLQTGVDVIHVPYGGTGPATTDLVGGHVEYMFNGLSATRPHLDEGALKALAVTGDERHPVIPDVPTFEELGYPEINPMSIWGAWVPAGTPREVIDRLSQAFNEAVNDPEVVEKLSGLGFTTVGSTPEEYRERARQAMATWAEVVEAADISVD